MDVERVTFLRCIRSAWLAQPLRQGLQLLHRWSLFTVLWLCLLAPAAASAQAQSARLSGFVTDQRSGQALERVNLVLDDRQGTLRGAVTDRDGLYQISRLEAGHYLVRASFIGYQTYTDTLELAPGQVRTLNIALVPETAALDEVLVESERTSGAARVTAGQQTIRPEEIELVPAPDVSGDLASYLTTLPGVVTTGDRGGQFFIRGGEPSQNLILLDGIPLFQPFHLLGFYSAFPTDIISRADLYAGGFGSRFGDHLSSVIDVSARSGNSRRFAGALSLSPFVSSARLEGPLVRDRISFLASARQSVIEQAARHVVDQRLPFVFGDVFAKLHTQPTQRSRVSVTALHTYDRGTLGETVGGASSEEIRWQNQAVGLRYLVLPRVYPVIADLHASVSRLRSALGPRADPARTTEVRDIRVTLDGTFPGRRVSIEAGWSVDVLHFHNELGGLYQNLERDDNRLNNFAFYLEPEFVFGGLRARPGARLQFYFARDKPLLEPRLRLVWTQGIHQISGAAGLYRQEFVGLSDRRDAASVFTAWTSIPKKTEILPDDVLAGRLPHAVHAIAGYRISPSASWEVSVEGFYKHLSDLIIAEWTAFPRFTTRLQPARGRSFGFDARLEVRRPSFYALVSYGLSSTTYEAEQAAIKIWYGVERLRFRPPHDRRHQVNALMNLQRYGFDVSARWAFGSGLPFSRAIGFDGFALIDDVVDAFQIPKSRRVIYERPFNGLLPAYHRLDVSLERSFQVRGARVVIQGSIINLYNRRNLFYLDVFTLQRVDQLPLVPSVGLKVEWN